jgi:hypothetical protein
MKCTIIYYLENIASDPAPRPISISRLPAPGPRQTNTKHFNYYLN